MSELVQALAVVIGLGLAWTAGHCAGMCGPLLLGLGVVRHDPAVGRLKSVLGALGRLGAYQFGRALGYAGLGAAAGWAGGGLATRLQGGEIVLGSLIAAACFIAALHHLGWVPWRRRSESASPGLVARFGAMIHGRLGRVPGLGPAALGLALILLPCGIVWWCVGVAAATADPLHGALVMVTLVVITTPALAGVAVAPALLPVAWRVRVAVWAGAWMVPLAWTLSGLWVVALTVQRWAAGGCCHPG